MMRLDALAVVAAVLASTAAAGNAGAMTDEDPSPVFAGTFNLDVNLGLAVVI